MTISKKHLWQTLSDFETRFPFLKEFRETFAQGELFLVGGAVRDLLWGRETKDYDFLVRGVSAKDLGAFLKKRGKVSWVGKHFGVYKFYPTDPVLPEAIDIALPRTESSFTQNGSYRDFDIVSDPALPVEADLKRRDFTLNAIAADLSKRIIIDPFQGLTDLANKVLRTVGDAEKRFREDSSRLLRGLRFAAQFDLTIEAKTWSALKKMIPALNHKQEDGAFIVPRETIAKEFIKAMVCHPVRAYDLWDQSGAFSELMPELLEMKGCEQPTNYHSEGDVWLHTRLALSQLLEDETKAEFGEGLDAEVVLAVLFHDIAKPVTQQTPERDGTDRIRFNNHDHVGATMARKIVRRLKLSSYPKDSRYYVDEDHLAWLIDKHLLLVSGQIDQMRAATIEKHFLSPLRPGKKLLQVIYCDGMATVPEKKDSDYVLHYWTVKKRIEKIAALCAEKAKIPKPLLSGREVMEALNIASGPEVGKALALLREEQLNGRISTREAAFLFLKEQNLGLPFTP